MAESELKSLFQLKKNLIVLGLTGYTGAGCKTLANILRSEENPLILENHRHLFSDNSFSNKKLYIAEEYHKKSNEWHKFRSIKISHIILLISFYIPQNEINKYIETIKKVSNTNQKGEIVGKFENAKKEFIEKAKKLEIYNDLLNVVFSGKLEADELNKILTILKGKYKKNDIDNLLKEINDTKDTLCKAFNDYQKGFYTLFFQYLGYMIRKGIDLELPGPPVKTHTTYIPSIICKLIHSYQHINYLNSQNGEGKNTTYIVIEGIRNHIEIQYLREHFANFFMLAVHRTEKERKKSLIDKYNNKISEFIDYYEKGSISKALKVISKKEDSESSSDGKDRKNSGKLIGNWYTDDEKLKAEIFWLSDISKCIQLCDIHLFNARQSDTYNDLRAQLCWYLALIFHPGLFTPTEHERAMNLAFQSKLNSGCISRQVGAVVTDSNFMVMSVGCNEVPRQQTPCILRSVNQCITCSKQDADYSDYEKVSVYEKSSFKYHLVHHVYPDKEVDSDKQTSPDFIKIVKKSGKLTKPPEIKWDQPIPLVYCFKDE